jgi:hypothetical protein
MPVGIEQALRDCHSRLSSILAANYVAADCNKPAYF